MLTLYTHPMSPCAQKVRIVLAEKGVEWKAHFIDLKNKENLEPWYLKLNHLGVVPTLVDNGKSVIESSLICEYLDEAYPENPLRPTDPYQRFEIRFWQKHVDNKLHPSCGAIQWPMLMLDMMLAKPEEERNALLARIPEKARRDRQTRIVKYGYQAQDIKDGINTYYQTMITMEKTLKDNDWIVGDSFSLADATLAPYFQSLIQFGWEHFYEEEFPGIARWVNRLLERPSYKIAIGDELIPEMLATLKKKGQEAWPEISAHLIK